LLRRLAFRGGIAPDLAETVYDVFDCVPVPRFASPNTTVNAVEPASPAGGDGGDVYLYYHGLIRKFNSGTAAVSLSGADSFGGLVGTAGGLGNNGCSDGTEVACAGFNKDLTRYPLDADVNDDGTVTNVDWLRIGQNYNDEPGDNGYTLYPGGDINGDLRFSVQDIARVGFELGRGE